MPVVKSSRNQARKRLYADQADKSSRNENALEKPVVGRIETVVDAQGHKSVKVIHDEREPAKSSPSVVEQPAKVNSKQMMSSDAARVQIAELDSRLGKGIGAAKERAKLAARI